MGRGRGERGERTGGNSGGVAHHARERAPTRRGHASPSPAPPPHSAASPRPRALLARGSAPLVKASRRPGEAPGHPPPPGEAPGLGLSLPSSPRRGGSLLRRGVPGLVPERSLLARGQQRALGPAWRTQPQPRPEARAGGDSRDGRGTPGADSVRRTQTLRPGARERSPRGPPPPAWGKPGPRARAEARGEPEGRAWQEPEGSSLRRAGGVMIPSCQPGRTPARTPGPGDLGWGLPQPH